MDKGNDYRKIFSIDRFARHWYCQHARLNQLRMRYFKMRITDTTCMSISTLNFLIWLLAITNLCLTAQES